MPKNNKQGRRVNSILGGVKRYNNAIKKARKSNKLIPVDGERPRLSTMARHMSKINDGRESAKKSVSRSMKSISNRCKTIRNAVNKIMKTYSKNNRDGNEYPVDRSCELCTTRLQIAMENVATVKKAYSTLAIALTTMERDIDKLMKIMDVSNPSNIVEFVEYVMTNN